MDGFPYVATAVSLSSGCGFPHVVTALSQKTVDLVLGFFHCTLNKQWMVFNYIFTALFQKSVDPVFLVLSRDI